MSDRDAPAAAGPDPTILLHMGLARGWVLSPGFVFLDLFHTMAGSLPLCARVSWRHCRAHPSVPRADLGLGHDLLKGRSAIDGLQRAKNAHIGEIRPLAACKLVLPNTSHKPMLDCITHGSTLVINLIPAACRMTGHTTAV